LIIKINPRIRFAFFKVVLVLKNATNYWDFDQFGGAGCRDYPPLISSLRANLFT
jgi:hypothetical protein